MFLRNENDILSIKIVLIYEKRYFKNFEIIWRRKLKSQGQSINFDYTLTFYKIREKKGEKILQKLYFWKLERKENFDIKIVIFREELDLL